MTARLTAPQYGSSPFQVMGSINAGGGGSFQVWNLDNSYSVTISLAGAQLSNSWLFNLPTGPGSSGQALLSGGGGLLAPCTWGSLSNISGVLNINQGGTSQVTGQTARGVNGLNIDAGTTVGDTNYTILHNDRTIFAFTAFTAARTFTLPPSSAANPGQRLTILADGMSATNTLTLTKDASDSFIYIPQGQNFPTSITYSTPIALELVNLGSSGWTLVNGQGYWNGYTPVVTSNVGAITSYTATGIYTVIGKTAIIAGTITVTNNGTGAGFLSVTMPPNMSSNAEGYGVARNFTAGFMGYAGVDGFNNTSFFILKYDGTYPVATGQQINFSFAFPIQ